MKPDWDKLMDDFAGSKSAGVYDVDCTGEGKDLCEEIGVSGYPTIKYGDASDKKDLQVYEGDRDYASLKAFADDKLGPVCRPGDLNACSEEDKGMLEGFLKMAPAELTAQYKKAAKEQKDKDKKLIKRKSKNKDKTESLKEDESEYLQTKVKKGKEAEHEKKGKKLKDRKKKIEAENADISLEETELKENAKKIKLMKMASEASNSGKQDL